ncbi:MAG: glycosyltransferase family 2 protein [Candidatus Eiseniibacteriota bacterium]
MRAVAIVPAYNEEASVGGVVRELLSRGDVDVVVIDDGSSDATGEKARAAGARVVVLPFNLGIGGAVQTGYQFARDHGYEVAVQVDGDGQHLPSEIDRLVAVLNGGAADLALGSRFVGEAHYHAPASRRVGMIVFSAVVSAITGQRLRDTTSGFRAAGRGVIEYCAEHYPSDYPEVEALVLLRRAGFRVVETACEFRERSTGHSSITAGRSAYYMVKVLLAIAIGLFRRVPSR